jgi:hypothetical protein
MKSFRRSHSRSKNAVTAAPVRLFTPRSSSGVIHSAMKRRANCWRCRTVADASARSTINPFSVLTYQPIERRQSSCRLRRGDALVSRVVQQRHKAGSRRWSVILGAARGQERPDRATIELIDIQVLACHPPAQFGRAPRASSCSRSTAYSRAPTTCRGSRPHTDRAAPAFFRSRHRRTSCRSTSLRRSEMASRATKLCRWLCQRRGREHSDTGPPRPIRPHSRGVGLRPVDRPKCRIDTEDSRPSRPRPQIRVCGRFWRYWQGCHLKRS